MPRTNGGITGISNRPSYTLAGGVWGAPDVENNLRIGNWPLAVSSTTVAVANSTSIYIRAYPFTSGVGYGTVYNDPATLPTSNGQAIDFNSTGTAVVLGTGSSPFIYAYPWVTGSGYGSAYSNPAVASNTLGVSFSPNNQFVATAQVTPVTGGVAVYGWSDASGFGTRFSPSSAAGMTGYSVSWHPNGAEIAVAASTNPFLYVYPWTDNVGFGTKYNNPATLPPGTTPRTVSFSNTGNDVVIGSDSTPFIRGYPWTTGVGFGTAYSNPGALPDSFIYGSAWNGNSTAVAFAASTVSTASQRSLVYSFTSGAGFGALYSSPANTLLSTGLSVSWTPSNNDLAFGSTNLNNPNIYQWSNSTGFGTRYAFPTVPPTGNVNGISLVTVPS